MEQQNPQAENTHFYICTYWSKGTCHAKCAVLTSRGQKTITCSCRQDQELAERIVAEMQASREQILQAFESGSTWRSGVYDAYRRDLTAAVKRAAEDRTAARRTARMQRNEEARQARRQRTWLSFRVECPGKKYFKAVADYRQGNTRKQITYSTDHDRDLAKKIVSEMKKHRADILKHFRAGTRWRSQVHEAPRPKPEVRSCWVSIKDIGPCFKVVAEIRIGSVRRTRNFRVVSRELAERLATEMLEHEQELIDSVASGVSWDSSLQGEIEAESDRKHDMRDKRQQDIDAEKKAESQTHAAYMAARAASRAKANDRAKAAREIQSSSRGTRKQRVHTSPQSKPGGQKCRVFIENFGSRFQVVARWRNESQQKSRNMTVVCRQKAEEIAAEMQASLEQIMLAFERGEQWQSSV